MNFIIEKVKEIFLKRFNIKLDDAAFSKELNLGLTGIGLNYYDLLYLIKDVEETFGFQITSAAIENGRIRTLKGLTTVIKEDLKKATLLSS